MNSKSIWLILTFTFSSFFAFSQNQKFKVDSTFSNEILEMLNRTKSEEAMAIASDFDQLWVSGGLNQNQKQKIVEIANKMYRKGFRPKPHFQNYIGTIVYALNTENIDEREFSNLLNVSTKVLDQLDNKEINNHFATLKDFFYRRALFYSSYNKLYIENDSYTIDYVETVVEEEPEALDQDEGTAIQEEDDGWFDDWDDESQDDWDGALEDTEEEDPEQAFAISDEPQPIIEGPVIRFDQTDLVFVTPFDSAFLTGTQGSLMLKNSVFVGKKGKFDWLTAGLGRDSVYAEMNEYNFNTGKAKLSAERVKMTYTGKVERPVEGVFDFESRRHEGPEDARFPRFKSYESDVNVKFTNDGKLLYKGGFSLEGNKISSSSVYEGLASITIRKKGVKQFVSRSNRFILSDSLIEAKRANVTIYHGADSISHPAVQVRYNFKSDNLVVLKDEDNFKYTPYFASHFNIDITADIIRWDLNTDSLDIAILNARDQIPAYFESREYFNADRFKEMTGLYNFHPLLMVVGYSRKVNSSEFNVDDIVKFTRQNPKVVRSAMEYLRSHHFIDYSPFSGMIKVRRKAYHTALSKNGKKDFDNLLITSKATSKPNATFKIPKRELTIRGIDKFYISKLLDIYIIPDDREVTLLRNRDFRFNGKIFAGNFEYIGKEFTFRYDSFLFDLKKIDSIKFYLEEKTEDGFVKKQVDNQLVSADSADAGIASLGSMGKTSGTLYINKPNNKSARKLYPGYPYFDASNGAIVYFNGEDVLGGAYADMSVYFILPPFKMDSLSSSDASTMSFDGTFVTSGLLPEFKEKLRIMPDNSLGFEHSIPPDGYDIYSSKGKVYNNLKLDKNGLRANGEIEYLTTTLQSEDFVFYVDSITTDGTSANIAPGQVGNASFPDISVENYRMKWLPMKDSMYIHNLDESFSLYNATASLYGFVNITPKGVLGGGQLFTRGSEAVSEKLAFGADYYSARNAKFEIKSDNPDKPALQGDDIRLNFNLVDNIAEISPEVEGVAALNFPYAQVKTSITNATWNLEDRTVMMEKPEDVDINSSYFYTTREELDSLAFNASSASYDINELRLNVSGIPFIKVADAKITPENGHMTILENFALETLRNATLEIDTLNGYHNLFDGNITILSRNKFEGDATYELISAADTFGIKFNSFELEVDEERRRGKRVQTVSRGTITEFENVLVSPGMKFKGLATMYASRPALELDGHVKLDIKKYKNYNTWIEYNRTPDSTALVIDYNNMVTESGEQPASGLHFESENSNLYATFMYERRGLGDEDFFVPGGMLSYNESDSTFKIEEPLKTTGSTYSGRSLTYNDYTSSVTFEGPLDFTASTSRLDLVASGTGSGNVETGEFDINSFLVFNFEVADQALNSMALDMADIVDRLGLPEAHDDVTPLLYKASEIIGERAAKTYEDKSLEDYTPLVSISSNLIRTLVLSEVKLKWSKGENAFYNVMDGKIGVSNILRNDVNAKVDGFVEIRKPDIDEGSDEIVNIFLKISSTWYYLGYSDNRLTLVSNNEEFNEIVNDRTNVAKAKLGEYVFIAGEISDAENFVNEFRKIYYDIDEPFELDRPVEVVADEEQPTDTTEETDDDDEGF
ncbi:hypothetical protein QQ008_23600 [Fulvivirgaceae bacterium BMA10]|uniref:Uncharacterized protein n=1 Tax=Splendidivirga corallicola TaxID=3051826 RepID=A0ABT8KW79_9BACT|nr:hypothetical protein [Fulvivirgaceae bacterium BMA10]